MSALTETSCVVVIGAGTMGAGIAQVAATHGWHVLLMDVDEAVARKAIAGIAARLDRLVEKERITTGQRDAIAARLEVAGAAADLSHCSLVIEAIVEDLEVKAAVLSRLIPALARDAIIATNTSSLSVTQIGAAIGAGPRTVGMHFFNPAPLLRLVEIIAGRETDPDVVERAAVIATSWGKTVARAADVPGFIVNHVARPYYLEAFRILEDRLAPVGVIDNAMKTLGGFRMGPLELTDLIGQDVNAKTTRSVWEQLDRPPLLQPCSVQDALVASGHLGRKSGGGLYRYGGPEPTPAFEIDVQELDLPAATTAAVDAFVLGATEREGSPLEQYVFARILVALIIQAHLAFERGVAEKADIDTALKYGVNYPKGPFEWSREIGPATCATLIERLGADPANDRFTVPAGLAVRV